MRRFQKYRLCPLMALAAAVLLAGGITLLALWCQPNALGVVLSHMKAQPLLILLNAMPVGLLLLAAAFLLKNVFWGASLINFAVCALSIANRIKLEVRDEPVFPRDFALLKEAGSAMGSYDIHFPWALIATVLAVSLILAVLGILVGCKPLSFPGKKGGQASCNRVPGGWLVRILGAGASLGVLTGLIFTVYASTDLYNSFHVSNAYYIPSVFNELGFPYCFCHQFTTYPIDKPAGFSKSEAAAWSREESVLGVGAPVNVVMVMNEAFSDISDTEGLHWPEDPLPNLHALQQDPHAITGHIVVPGFAGGTANTEFDVLTGMQTNALSKTTTSAFRVVNRNLDSLLRIFGGDGYHTSFFHPGDDWFYNRENVYRWLGAEETRFIDEMPDPESKGRWVTDAYAAGLIEAEFETAAKTRTPLFHYTTTIQNHMSYTPDKYGDGYVYPPVETSLPLSDQVRTLLEVYTEGARDADAMLGRLQGYFAAREEPVILVFFGDHLPYLGDNQLGYAELGTTQEIHWNALLSYETPYVIWANDAAAKTLDWDSSIADLALPEDNTISAAFLGATVLELTGRGEENPWFRFLIQLRRMAPVIQKETCVLSDGQVISPLHESDPELQAAIEKWRQWSYYKLRYQEIPS